MRNKKLYIVYILLFFIIFSFGYEANKGETISAIEFFSRGFDNFQTCLFTGTILMLPIVLLTHIHYLKPEINIRIRNKLFEYVWTKNLKMILITTIFIFISFIVVAFMYGYDQPFGIINTSSLLRVVSFITACFVIPDLIYMKYNKMFLGCSLLIGFNFVLLIFITNYSFFVKPNTNNESLWLFILNIYTFTINMVGLIYLYIKSEKKELLS